jgi:4-amino-4-deoxy-L-arabinose transferase-like glycosyltransferase
MKFGLWKWLMLAAWVCVFLALLTLKTVAFVLSLPALAVGLIARRGVEPVLDRLSQ